MRVWLKTSEGLDAAVDPKHITHVTPSGLPGCSVLHGQGAPFFLIVLGDPRDVIAKLEESEALS